MYEFPHELFNGLHWDLKKILEMLGFDCEYPVGQPKDKVLIKTSNIHKNKYSDHQRQILGESFIQECS